MSHNRNQDGFIPLIPLIVVGVVALGGGTALAAQNAVPGDALYGVKNLTEVTRVALAFGGENKARVRLAIAEEKVRELEELETREVNADRVEEAVTKARENHEEALIKAREAAENGQDVDELIQRLEQNLERQQDVLRRVLDKVPDQAKPAIERSLQESEQGLLRAIEAIKDADARRDGEDNDETDDTSQTDRIGEEDQERELDREEESQRQTEQGELRDAPNSNGEREEEQGTDGQTDVIRRDSDVTDTQEGSNEGEGEREGER